MIPLPESMYDTYRHYKRGTDKVVNWLYQTGGGGGSGNGSPNVNQNSTTKPNAYAREILQYAKRIVKTGKVIPSDILYTLEDVIRARSKCASWYRKQVKADFDPRHQSHEYFINVLADVHKIIRPLAEKTDRNGSKAESQKTDTPPKVENQFEYLSVHEPRELKTYNSDCPLMIAAAKKARANQVSQDAIRIEEKLFALHCFLDDAVRIRKFIVGLWESYAKGELGLTSAAITSNAAFHLLKQANEALIAEFPDMDDHEKVIIFFADHGYSLKIEDRSESREIVMRGLKNDSAIADFSALCSLTCLRTWYDHLRWRVRKASCADDNPDRGYIPPHTFCETGKKNDMYWKDFENADALAVDYVVLGDAYNLSIDYQVIEGFNKAIKSSNFPSWLVIVFDIISRLDWTLWQEGIEQPYEELQDYLAQATAQLSKFHKWSRTWNTGTILVQKSYAENFALWMVGWVAEWSKRDAVQKIKDQTPGDGPTLIATPRHFLLKRDPIFCGIILSHVKVMMHILGIRIMNNCSDVVLTAHLYNAGLQSWFLTPIWKDMEDFIAIHSLENTIWLTTRPKNLASCVARIYAALGLSNKSRLRGEFLNPVMRLKTKNQPFSTAVFSLSPGSRIRATSLYAKWYAQKFNNQLTENEAELPKGFVAVMMLVIEEQLERVKEHKKNSSPTDHGIAKISEKIQEKRRKRQKLDQIEILEVFSRGLEAEDFHFSFDYLSMAERCADFATKFHDACKKRCPEPDPMEGNKDHHLANVFSTLEIWARGFGTGLLELSCDLLSTLILAEGNVEFTKNHSLAFRAARKAEHINLDAIGENDNIIFPPNHYRYGKVILNALFDVAPKACMEVSGVLAHKDFTTEWQSQKFETKFIHTFYGRGPAALTDEKSRKMQSRNEVLIQILEGLHEKKDDIDPALSLAVRRFIFAQLTRSELLYSPDIAKLSKQGICPITDPIAQLLLEDVGSDKSVNLDNKVVRKYPPRLCEREHHIKRNIRDPDEYLCCHCKGCPNAKTPAETVLKLY